MSRQIALCLAAAALVAACGSTSAPGDAPPANDGLREIRVELSNSLKFAPDLFDVKAGETVRFVVANTSSLDHEFFIGDEVAQDAHAKEMSSTGGRLQDSASGVGVRPRQVESLVFTFDAAGSLIVACHIPGHFGAGMRATIAIAP